MQRPRTVGQLRQSGYHPLHIKEEIRRNLVNRLRRREPLFPGLVGYEDTVVPEIVHALLARHDVLLLGLRGQGKTRILRQLVDLLDEAVPIVAGSELRDDPLAPISAFARERLREQGDETPVEWIGRSERYLEKLATPDVTMADLFGDVDLVKHIQGRSLADEQSLHFGLIPRANRGLFCINELPDLSPKIQVGLFNLLQERDVQIRGYPVRFELDVCLVFSANPEDYTSRGRIVTPLKDRIGSVVRTHYPRTRAEGVAIADGSARESRAPLDAIVPGFMKEIVEEIARQARSSAAINQQSGVSARLAIAGRELLVSSAERRALVLGESTVVPRVSDLSAVIAAARGKVELLLPEEDAREDPLIEQLTGEAVRLVFIDHTDSAALRPSVEWFRSGGTITVGDSTAVEEILRQAQGNAALLEQAGLLLGRMGAGDQPALLASAIEFLLEGLHRTGKLGKRSEGGGRMFAVP